MVMFAAATGLRPGEWIALEQRDIDREARVVYVRRAYRNGRLKCTKTEASVRAVPLQAIALAMLEQLPADTNSALLFPAARGGHVDLHNFRNRDWKPAQHAAGITPLRRVYDLRHTFATVALTRRHLHLRPLSLHGRQPDDDRPPVRPPRPRRPRPCDQPPDAFTGSDAVNVHPVVAAWTSQSPIVARLKDPRLAATALSSAHE